MPTVIDSLIVELGIDATKFTDGERKALESMKKTREGAEQFGKSVEHNTMKLTDVFSVARKGALGLLGAFAGGEIASFVQHVVDMDAATGRFAKTIGTSVPNLSTWQGMIRQVGGEASSATSTLASLQQAVEDMRQGGTMLNGGFMTLAGRAGANLAEDGPDAILRKIQKYIAGEVQSGRMTPPQAATHLRRIPGMNEDMLNLLLADFNKIEEAAKAAGVASDENVKAAQKLQSTWSTFTTAIERWGANVITLFEKASNNEATGQDVKNAASGLSELDKKSGGFAFWGLGTKFGDWMRGQASSLYGGAASSGAPSPASAGGTSRGDRNNNPGNMEYGDFARKHGAIGSDGRFAIFPDRETGSKAMVSLVQSSNYQGLTLEQFGNKYSEGAPAWKKTVGGALGIGPNDIIDNKDPRLIDAMMRAEGTGARGAALSRVNNSRTSNSNSSVETNIGKVEIHAPNARDANDIAGEIGGALKRRSLIQPASQGLT